MHNTDPARPPMTAITDLGDLMRLARLSLAEPRAAAQVLLHAPLPREALWMMFCLVVVAAMLFAQLNAIFIEAAGVPQLGADAPNPPPMMISPLAQGILQGLVLGGVAMAVHRLGRLFGGDGDFDGALMLVTFHQFIFILVQAATVVISMIFPPFAFVALLVATGLFFWILVNFIAELHGFTSLLAVFGVVIVAAAILYFILLRVILSLGLVATIG